MHIFFINFTSRDKERHISKEKKMQVPLSTAMSYIILNNRPERMWLALFCGYIPRGFRENVFENANLKIIIIVDTGSVEWFYVKIFLIA